MTEAKNKSKGKASKGTFRLKKENSRILKGIIESLANLIDETEFQVTQKEFTITAMDQSRICLFKLTIEKEHFDEYECSGEIKAALNLDDLDKILKRSSNKDSIELSFNEEEQKFKIKMHEPGTSRTRTFRLSAIEMDVEEVPMESLLKIVYNSKWQMDPDFFIEAIKDAEIYAEILNIKTIEDEGLHLSSSSAIGEMEYEIELEDLIDHEITEMNSGSYSLTFLKAIMKMATITETFKISLLTDHPLRLLFELIEGGHVDFFLAPRTEDENSSDEEEENMDEF